MKILTLNLPGPASTVLFIAGLRNSVIDPFVDRVTVELSEACLVMLDKRKADMTSGPIANLAC